MRDLLTICLSGTLLTACGDSSGPANDAPLRFVDPQGDTVAVANPTARATDVVATEVTVFADSILFRLEFAGPVSAWSQGLPTGLDGFLDLDLDQNATTGVPGVANAHGGDAQLGAEWFLDLRDDGTGTIDLVNAASTSQRIAVPIRFLGPAVEIRVPRAVLADVDGRFWLAYLVENDDRPVSDFAPNTGHYTVTPQ